MLPASGHNIVGWIIGDYIFASFEYLEDLMPWQWVIVFDDEDDFRENFAEIREQLFCEEVWG